MIPHVLENLKDNLRKMNDQWEMVFVTSGFEALESFAKNPFDVLVTDLSMPGMDGIELLNRIQRNYSNVTGIILTGHSGPEVAY